ncbi:ATP-binding protein [Pedobacter hartonius]|uniref:histidine kinase n=1 Tax=Pedobacter hartonius TaxID=425514 RepID=A0A1H4HAP2_9SPHI|nr:ATP-binding protein [Pedobacter hartonius]SEB18874.1 PAS domain S-box-containing protein [Pedobacter hartonius]
MENTFGINIIPENDLQRIEVLKRYKILDTPPENAFDHIAKLATQIFGVPISMVSLVDAEQVYFKANVGMGKVRSTSRGVSLCSLAVLSPGVTVFEDATVEPCLLVNPLVAGDFGLKFYAGAPITTPDGFLIGTLCVVDKKTRIFTEQDKIILQGLATLAMDDIELRLSAIEENEKQEQIQLLLAESEYRARLIVNDAPVAIGVLNGEQLIIESANDKILEVWGKTSKIIGVPLHLAIPELKGQPFLGILNDVFTSGQPYYGNELKAQLNRNGQNEDVYFNFVYHPLKNLDDATTSILIVATDVTQQVNARLQIEVTERKLENMVLNSTVGMNIFKGRELIIELANQPMYNIWGRTPSQALGKPLLAVFPELIGQQFPELLEGIFDSGKTVEQVEIGVRIATDKGEKNLIINAKYVPLFDIFGEVESIVATVINITELVNARIFLEQSEEELQTINEELTTTNEELATLNEELSDTNEELSITQEYLQQSMTSLEESKVLLLKSEEMLRISTEAAEVHTWQVDLKTDDFTASANLKNLLGFTTYQEMTFEAMNTQIVAEHRSRVQEEFEHALRQTQTFDVEYKIIRENDNQNRWLRTKGKLLLDSDEKPAYFSGIVIDITEKKEGEIRKNDFIAMVSHELKTPLTSLKGYLQLLNIKNKKNEDPFTTSALAKGDKQVNKMLSIIDGFLNVSEMDAGKITLHKEIFNLSDVVDEIGKDVQLTTLTHVIEIADCRAISVHADMNKIGQVINNFLSNAIKYSQTGKKIQIFCEEIEGNVRVGVKDEGEGIRQQDAIKLFDRFYRVDNQESKTIAGFGIGLYICAEIIRRHEGKIWIDSTIGKGSTFYFSLPLGSVK